MRTCQQATHQPDPHTCRPSKTSNYVEFCHEEGMKHFLQPWSPLPEGLGTWLFACLDSWCLNKTCITKEGMRAVHQLTAPVQFCRFWFFSAASTNSDMSLLVLLAKFWCDMVCVCVCGYVRVTQIIFICIKPEACKKYINVFYNYFQN